MAPQARPDPAACGRQLDVTAGSSIREIPVGLFLPAQSAL
jgi:hypothetical protein